MERETTARDLAQAISGVLDDATAGAIGSRVDLSSGVFIHDYVDGGQDSSSAIEEVGAELVHGEGGRESFTIKTSDGRTFIVTVESAVES